MSRTRPTTLPTCRPRAPARTRTPCPCAATPRTPACRLEDVRARLRRGERSLDPGASLGESAGHAGDLVKRAAGAHQLKWSATATRAPLPPNAGSAARPSTPYASVQGWLDLTGTVVGLCQACSACVPRADLTVSGGLVVCEPAPSTAEAGARLITGGLGADARAGAPSYCVERFRDRTSCRPAATKSACKRTILRSPQPPRNRALTQSRASLLTMTVKGRCVGAEDTRPATTRDAHQCPVLATCRVAPTFPVRRAAGRAAARCCRLWSPLSGIGERSPTVRETRGRSNEGGVNLYQGACPPPGLFPLPCMSGPRVSITKASRLEQRGSRTTGSRVVVATPSVPAVSRNPRVTGPPRP